MTYKKIMLATDGSDTSHCAAQEIIKLAKDNHVVLRIIHVVDESFLCYGGGTFDYLSYIVMCKKEGQKILDDTKKLITDKIAIKVETSLVELKPLQGRIAELIVEEARDCGAELLVMGTHGRRGFTRFFLGSVAENVVRIATMPVLLVHGTGA